MHPIPRVVPPAGARIRAPGRGRVEAEGVPLSFFRCECSKPSFKRVRRPAWMRVLPLLRLYRCLACGRNVLRTRVGLRDVYPLF